MEESPTPPQSSADKKVLEKWGGMGRVVKKMMGKTVKVLVLITLLKEGPEAAARDLVFADEIEAAGEELTRTTRGIRKGLQHTRIDRWLGED